MPDSYARLSVLFEAPFWVALYERNHGGKYEVCKITFGAEPKDYEVYRFFLDNFNRLDFTPPLDDSPIPERKLNPKRLQRQIRAATGEKPIGTKAQQALKLQHEQTKIQRQTRSQAQKEAQAQRQYALRQQKRREKHKGR